MGCAFFHVREPTENVFDRYGRDDIKRIVSKSRMLEYSVAPLSMNDDALPYKSPSNAMTPAT